MNIKKERTSKIYVFLINKMATYAVFSAIIRRETTLI